MLYRAYAATFLYVWESCVREFLCSRDEMRLSLNGFLEWFPASYVFYDNYCLVRIFIFKLSFCKYTSCHSSNLGYLYEILFF